MYFSHWRGIIILSVCAVSLKSAITNFQLRFHYYFLSPFNCSRHITVCVIALTVESTLRDYLIIGELNTFSSLSFFLTELLFVARCSCEFSSNFELISWSKTFPFFDCCRDIILIICTLPFEFSFGHDIILFWFKLFSWRHSVPRFKVIKVTGISLEILSTNF
jgi:hypothetical protein